MSESKGTNWKMLLAVAAAVVGVGCAAAVYVKRMKAKSQSVDGMIDDIVDFCKTKAAELDTLVREVSPSKS